MTNLMFGVCQLTPDIKITETCLYAIFKRGSFTHVSNIIYVGNVEGHRIESSDINRYDTDDLMSVEYFSETEKVIVRNITKNTSSISYIKTDRSLPLYVGVILTYEDD